MLSKTHIAVGLAASVTIINPHTAEEIYPVIIGGAIGSVICDIDCKWDRPSKDALVGRIIAGTLAAGALIGDIIARGEIYRYLWEVKLIYVLMGLILFGIIGFFARESEHRTFSHSLIALTGFSVAVALACRPVTLAFIIGWASHLILDLFNYKPLQLLYPLKKGFSLKLCYAKSTANTITMIGGLLWLFVWFILHS